MKATIVIPSYWGRASGEQYNESDAVYDHPTMLDQPGTLERALQSISILENRDYNVVVIAACTCEDIAKQAEEKVKEIAAKYKGMFQITCVSHTFEERMRSRLQEVSSSAGVDSRMVSLSGYSNIRNMCLMVAQLARSEIAVLLDDDEIYEDPKYLDKVFEDMEASYEGKPIRALAGYYLRHDGGYLLPTPPWYYAEWPMTSAMNAAFRETIGKEPRFKPTPYVFGGNMCVHRDVFSRIAFDPNVRRGEDTDYLLNCRFFGIDFILDNELAIKHLPPEKETPAWLNFRENIYRFVYQREKLRHQNPGEGMSAVKVEDLDPYPGRCMRDDLEDLIYRTCVLLGMYYMHEAMEQEAKLRKSSVAAPSFMSRRLDVGMEESMKNVLIGRYQARPAFDPYDWYMQYRQGWERLMEFLSTDEQLSGELLGGMK